MKALNIDESNRTGVDNKSGGSEFHPLPISLDENNHFQDNSGDRGWQAPSLEIKPLNQEDCEYLGFECSKVILCPQQYFDKKKADVLAYLDNVIDKEHAVYLSCDGHLERQIKYKEQEIERIRQKLNEHLSSMESISTAIEGAVTERSRLEKELKKKLLDWGQKKAAIIETAIENLKKEIQQYTDSYKDIYSKRQEVNRQKFEDHKEANAEMLRRSQDEEQSIRSELVALMSKLAVLYLDKGSRFFAGGIVVSGILISILVSWLYFYGLGPELFWLEPIEGLGMGFLLAIFVGFLSYFYHSRIVEARILIHKAKGEVNYWLANIEMLITSSLGLVSAAILINNAFFPGSALFSLSFGAFTLSVFCTGILLGYGMRMWKLLNHLYALNQHLVSINRNIIALQRPEPLDISNEEAEKFKKELNYHHEKLYQLLSIKYSLPKYALGYRDWYDRDYWILERTWWSGKRLLRRLLFFLPVSSELAEQVNPKYSDEELADQNFRILNWERHLFPDVIADLEITRESLAKARLKEKGLFKKMMLRRKEEDDLAVALRKYLDTLITDQDGLISKRKKLAKESMTKIQSVQEKKILFGKSLDIGFNVGLKYLNEVGSLQRLE